MSLVGFGGIKAWLRCIYLQGLKESFDIHQSYEAAQSLIEMVPKNLDKYLPCR